MLPYETSQTADSLIGKVRTAKVISRHVDSCDFRLDGGERVRLYQYDSFAADDPRLMKDLPQYAERQTCRFMITHRRMDGKNILYYANERWADSDPWQDLILQHGDRVQGRVIRTIHNEQNILKGYLVKLDPTLHLNQNPNKSLQPDIPVYIPLDTLPWADGSTGHTPASNSGFQKMLLETGDQVQAVITEIHTLPHHPVASVIRGIQYQNATFWSDAYTTAWGAWIKERLHTDQLLQTAIDNIDEATFLALLQGLRILLVDDREDSLKQLKQTLEGNGASVLSILHTPASLYLNDLATILLVHIQQFRPNLILIDNALPQPFDGLQLAQALFALQTEALPIPTCALISSLFLPEDIGQIQEQAPYLKGALMRPLLPQQIINLAAGKEEWSGGIQLTDTLPNLPQQQNINVYCMKLLREGLLDSVTIIANEQGQMRWEYGAGETPFSNTALNRLVLESDLHLLLEKRVENVHQQRADHADTRLLGNRLAECYWFSVFSHDGSLTRLVGFGWKKVGHYHLALALRDSIREKYANLEIHAWVKHNANFISSGIAVHSIIHEYRNYLNQLGTGLDTLEAGIQKQQIDAVKDIPANLRKSMLQPLEDLASVLLKGQAKRTDPAVIPELLDTLDAMLKPYATEHGVDFRIINKPKLTLGIDTASILIPLGNLVSNAIKHHRLKQERKVSLLGQVVHENGNFWLEFQVQDNGLGIPAHQVGQLFQPGISFAKEANSQHGIGLWLSRSLAQKIGGDLLLIQNLRGLGVCFGLRIPQTLG